MALSGCLTSYVAEPPKVSEGLLQDCSAPYLVPDPNTQDSVQINEERLSVAEWGKCNEIKFHGVRDYLRRLVAKP